MVNKDSRLPPPWLKIALDEMNAGVKEDRSYQFKKMDFYKAAAKQVMAESEEQRQELRQCTVDQDRETRRRGKILIAANRATIVSALEKNDAEVSKYLETVRVDTIKDTDTGWQATAWCTAFVNWCLKEAGYPHPNFTLASDWVKFGVRLEHPRKGAIVVFRPIKENGSSTGHVAFYLHQEGERIWVVGGNQNASVSKKGYPANKVRGYFWPPCQANA